MNVDSLETLNFWLYYLLFVVIGVIIVNFYLVSMVYLGCRLVYKTNKKVYDNLTFYFDELGISQGEENKKMLTKWSSFVSTYETLGLYCFLISERQGIIIPKRVLTKEEQDWLKSKIK